MHYVSFMKCFINFNTDKDPTNKSISENRFLNNNLEHLSFLHLKNNFNKSYDHNNNNNYTYYSVNPSQDLIFI